MSDYVMRLASYIILSNILYLSHATDSLQVERHKAAAPRWLRGLTGRSVYKLGRSRLDAADELLTLSR